MDKLGKLEEKKTISLQGMWFQYTVQQQDILPSIGTLLSAEVGGIERLNKLVAETRGYIDVGCLLYVPMELKGTSYLKETW